MGWINLSRRWVSLSSSNIGRLYFERREPEKGVLGDSRTSDKRVETLAERWGQQDNIPLLGGLRRLLEGLLPRPFPVLPYKFRGDWPRELRIPSGNTLLVPRGLPEEARGIYWGAPTGHAPCEKVNFRRAPESGGTGNRQHRKTAFRFTRWGSKTSSPIWSERPFRSREKARPHQREIEK